MTRRPIGRLLEAHWRDPEAVLRRQWPELASKPKRRKRCESCGKDWADLPSKICPACEAYKDHQR